MLVRRFAVRHQAFYNMTNLPRLPLSDEEAPHSLHGDLNYPIGESQVYLHRLLIVLKNKKKITINDILIEKKQRKTSIKNPIVGGTPSLQITDLKNNPAKTKSFKLPVIIFTIREPSRW